MNFWRSTLALTPANDETFLREVDDAVRQDQVYSMWRRYGLVIIGVIAGGLLLLAGILYWRHHQVQQSGAVAEKADDVIDALARNMSPEPQAMTTLSGASQPGYRATTLLARATIAANKGDIKGASALYAQMAADEKLAQPYRDLGLLRKVALNFDSMAPQAVVDALKPLAVSGEPWFGSAGEMTAIAYMKMRKPDLAGALFASIAKDPSVPQTLRGRARQMAGMLGVDAVEAQ
jgi:hypothetical protein